MDEFPIRYAAIRGARVILPVGFALLTAGLVILILSPPEEQDPPPWTFVVLFALALA